MIVNKIHVRAITFFLKTYSMHWILLC